MKPTPKQIDGLAKAHLISAEKAKELKYRAAPFRAWARVLTECSLIVMAVAGWSIVLWTSHAARPGCVTVILAIGAGLTILSLISDVVAAIRKEPKL